MNILKKMPIKYHLVVWFSLAFIAVILVAGWILHEFIHDSVEQDITAKLKRSDNAIANMITTTAKVLVRNQLRVIAERNIEILNSLFLEQQQGNLTEQAAQRNA